MLKFPSFPGSDVILLFCMFGLPSIVFYGLPIMAFLNITVDTVRLLYFNTNLDFFIVMNLLVYTMALAFYGYGYLQRTFGWKTSTKEIQHKIEFTFLGTYAFHILLRILNLFFYFKWFMIIVITIELVIFFTYGYQVYKEYAIERGKKRKKEF